MNYSLNINLEGADKVNSSLDGLLSKLGSLSSGQMSDIELDKLIDTSGILKDSEKTGEQIGDSIKKGIKKSSLKPFGDDWAKAVFKGAVLDPNKFWNDAIKVGNKGLPQPASNKMDLKGLLVGGIATLFNPFVGARMLSDVVGKSNSGGGLFGKAGALGYGEIFIGVKTLSLAFDGLKKVVNQTMQAYESARKIYAKSLMSGMGVGFTTKRMIQSDILGVSEAEVIKFGAALAYLNPKIAWASNIIAKTANPLAAVGVEIKVMVQNFAALFALIAAKAAPAIMAFVEAVNGMVKAFGDTSVIAYWVDLMSKAAAILVSVFGAIVGAIQGLVVGLQLLSDTIVAIAATIYNTYLKIISSKVGAGIARSAAVAGALSSGSNATEANKIGNQAYADAIAQKDKQIKMSDVYQPTIDASNTFQKTMDGFQKMAEGLWNGSNGKMPSMPEPQAYMKQLPASAWEKLGLVIGGGGNSTNDLIRKSNGYLKAIADTVSKTGSGRGAGFGMSPVTANP